MYNLQGVSLFSSCGIAEMYLKELNIKINTANELLKDRAQLYTKLYKDTNMIQGDIREKSVFNNILKSSGNKVDFLLASPPCQGLSIAGKNRTITQYLHDERNSLINKVIDFIKIKYPSYVLIENVPELLKLQIIQQNKPVKLIDFLESEFSNKYIIDPRILDASDYGIPQKRKRAIIKLFDKNLTWGWPSKEKKVTVRDTIGHLPSLEAGEKSDIPWHYARKHITRHIIWMNHTPTGHTAFSNKEHYPQKKDGTRIKGYNSTYRRIKWDEPSPTITIRNDAISSQRKVHPGRLLKDGTYSDARVLTPLEIMLLSSIPEKNDIPLDTSELLIRRCIGECIPPLMVKKIVACIR
jgi:DNA (cytosine-5)-methyltransferase 1